MEHDEWISPKGQTFKTKHLPSPHLHMKAIVSKYIITRNDNRKVNLTHKQIKTLWEKHHDFIAFAQEIEKHRV